MTIALLFGRKTMLSILNDKFINLNHSLLGFEQLNQFIVKVVEEGSPYAFINSVEDEGIGFLVASPFSFFNDYTFELNESTMKDLKIESSDEVLVLGIITLSEPFIQSSMNLLAPIVLNVSNLEGRQIILPVKYNYGTKNLLYKETIAGEVD
ncbi:MAG: flagellar assembly protein FliW [Bacilli bacterium]|nr:flagellar assembly protein FliW [Bacilli bacterium]